MRVRMLVAEALRSLRASASTTLAATMTVLIGMFLLGLLIALGSWVVSWSDHVKRELAVKVYFCTPLPPCNRYATKHEENLAGKKKRTPAAIEVDSNEAALQPVRRCPGKLAERGASNFSQQPREPGERANEEPQKVEHMRASLRR